MQARNHDHATFIVYESSPSTPTQVWHLVCTIQPTTRRSMLLSCSVVAFQSLFLCGGRLMNYAQLELAACGMNRKLYSLTLLLMNL